MHPSVVRGATIAALFITSANALDGITVPQTVQAGEPFNVTFENADDDSQYRVFLGAALIGSNGPTCMIKDRISAPCGS